MNIGIVGLGIIGSACRFGFEKLGYKVSVHDIRLDTKLEDLLNTSITYI
jgi:6-phosphogluconate dehydrogenase